MAIDNCSHSFSDLAQQALPNIMKEINTSLKDSTPMSQFLVKNDGLKTLLKRHSLDSDFQGCYVLIENGAPLYVGISRQVFQRLWFHCRGKTHYTATLAYKIAAKQVVVAKMTRNARMSNGEFRIAFEEAKERIQRCNFAFIPIDNPLELYLFEAYCAMELDTWEWNTFRTH